MYRYYLEEKGKGISVKFRADHPKERKTFSL